MYHIEQYSILQWAVIFMGYCIFGWLFESAYCSLKSGKLQNRGFCHGPWIPIYGSGATLLILVAGPYRDNHLAVFLIGIFGGSALELITGWAMEKIFHMRWWDYSDNAFNFHGYICLYASIGWGFLALIIMDYVHPVIEKISQNWSYDMFLVINTMIYTLFIEDVIGSAIAAMGLKKRLKKLAENSEEIQRLRISIQDAYVRLDEAKKELDANMVAVKEVRESEGNAAAARVMAEGTVKAMMDSASAAEDKLRTIAENRLAENAANAEERKKSLQNQKDLMERRLALLLEGGGENMGRMNWWSKTMLRNNPEAVSKEPAFKILKEAAMKRRGKNNTESEKAEDTESDSKKSA